MAADHGVQHLYVAGLAVAYPFVVEGLHVSYALLGVVLTVAGLAGGLLQGAAGFLGRGEPARCSQGKTRSAQADLAGQLWSVPAEASSRAMRPLTAEVNDLGEPVARAMT